MQIEFMTSRGKERRTVLGHFMGPEGDRYYITTRLTGLYDFDPPYQFVPVLDAELVPDPNVTEVTE